MTEEKKLLDLSAYALSPSHFNKANLMLFYGPPKGGKTWLAASAALAKGLGPVAILDTEGSSYGTMTEFEGQDIDIFDASNFDDFNTLFDGLMEHPHKYNTIVVDTFDSIQEKALEQFKAEQEAIAAATHKEVNSFAQWGSLKAWSNHVAKALRDSSALGIILVHEKEEKSEETGKIISRLALMGSAKDSVPGIPDLIGHATRATGEDGKPVTTLRLGSYSEKFATGNRFEKRLPEIMVDPTIGKIMDIITRKAVTK